MTLDLPQMERFRPMRSDVMLVHVPRNKESDIIEIQEDPQNEDVQKFRVVSVGKEVTSVKPDDIVLVSWTRVTTPKKAVDKDGETVNIGFTDEKELLAIIEED